MEKESQAVNVSGDGIGYDFVALRVHKTCDALDGDVNTPRENHTSICVHEARQFC